MTIPFATYLEEINERDGQYCSSFTGVKILNEVMYRLSTATKPLFRLDWSNFDLPCGRIGFPVTIILLVKMQKI